MDLRSADPESLHEWAVEELNYVFLDYKCRIPNANALSKCFKGKNADIWKYVINFVRSKVTAARIRNTIERHSFTNDVPLQEEAERLSSLISAGKAKQNYLKSQVRHLQNRIYEKDCDLRRLQIDIDKVTEREKIYISHLDRVNQRIQYFKSAADQLNGNINSLKGNTCTSNSEIQRLKKFINNELVTVTNILYDVLNERPVIAKNKIQEDLRHYESKLSASEMISILKQMCENGFLLPSDSYGDSCDVVKKGSYVSPKLQSLRYDHVTTTFKSNQMSIKLVQLKENCYANNTTLWVKLSQMFGSKYEQIKGLLATEIDIEGSRGVITHLKASTKSLSQETSLLEIDLKNAQVMSDKCQNLKLNMCNCMCVNGFSLKQNNNLIDMWQDKKDRLYSFLLDIVHPEKAIIGTSISCTYENLNLELQFLKELVLYNSNIGKSIYTVDELRGLGDKINKALGIEPWQDLATLKDACIKWKLMTIFKKKEELENQDYTKEMEAEVESLLQSCNSRILKEEFQNFNATLQNIEQTLTNANEFIKGAEDNYPKVNLALDEWWKQEAQYIPDIVKENRPLKDWIKILNVL